MLLFDCEDFLSEFKPAMWFSLKHLHARVPATFSPLHESVEKVNPGFVRVLEILEKA